jgi:hypothetical protein
VKQGLGYLLKPEYDPGMLVERDPVQGPKYLRILMDAEEKIRKTIHEQEQVEAARVAP